MLDYYEMVETLKKDKFLSELPVEEVQAAELEITDLPCDKPSTEATLFHQGSLNSMECLLDKYKKYGYYNFDFNSNWLLVM